jgi:hypothetical protein
MGALVDILPTLDQVGRLIRARTTDGNMTEQVTFTSSTKPTDTQALAYISDAADDVELEVGPAVPDTVDKEATRLIAVRAAMLIELGYPEQIRANTSAYPELKALYDAQLAALLARLGGDVSDTDDTSAAGLPSYGIPDLGTPPAHTPGSELPLPAARTWMDW